MLLKVTVFLLLILVSVNCISIILKLKVILFQWIIIVYINLLVLKLLVYGVKMYL